MRRYGFVLAMAVLLAPALSHSQVHQANGAANAGASADAAESRTNDPASQKTPGRRSLMGMVMDVLIESAEQQSARQRASRQAAATGMVRAQERAASPSASMETESLGIAARERIAVESVESEP